jgi:hypothetical protein
MPDMERTWLTMRSGKKKGEGWGMKRARNDTILASEENKAGSTARARHHSKPRPTLTLTNSVQP